MPKSMRIFSLFLVNDAVKMPFRDRIRKKWQAWMPAGQQTFTANDRIGKMELDQICRWIHQALENIANKLFKKSFCKCCITNALDGT